jgi:hypothetical protein
MSHQETHGNLVVSEANEHEHPSHLNVEGQNAQHTSAAGDALPDPGPSRSRSNSDSRIGEEKGGGEGKPQMEKYAYHSTFYPFLLITCSFLIFPNPYPLSFLVLVISYGLRERGQLGLQFEDPRPVEKMC